MEKEVRVVQLPKRVSAISDEEFEELISEVIESLQAGVPITLSFKHVDIDSKNFMVEHFGKLYKYVPSKHIYEHFNLIDIDEESLSSFSKSMSNAEKYYKHIQDKRKERAEEEKLQGEQQ